MTPPVGAFNFEAVVVAVAAAVAAVVIIFFNIMARVLYCVMIDVIAKMPKVAKGIF